MNNPVNPDTNPEPNAPLQVATPSPKPDSNSARTAAWVQAGSTVGLAVLTLIYVWLIWKTVAATERMVAATEKTVSVQVEPVVELETHPWGEPTLVLSNRGSAAVVEVLVYLDTIMVFGPPANEVMGPTEAARCVPAAGCAWWSISRLEAGQTVRQSFFREAASALEQAKKLNDGRAAGRMDASRRFLEATLHPILSFRLRFHREVDRKPYPLRKAVLIVPESGSNTPRVLDSFDASFIAYFRETLGVLNPNR